MFSLHPLPPDDSFSAGPNYKLYPGALPDAYRDILAHERIHDLPIYVESREYRGARTFTFVRHLESRFNEYKRTLATSDMFRRFVHETDPRERRALAFELRADYFRQVGVDYEVELSVEGHAQGEIYARAFREFFRAHGDLFPERIYVSPYRRTKQTAWYLLRDVEGLDIDFSILTDETSYVDMAIGKYHGRTVIVSLSEDVREKEFGPNVGPGFLREFFERDADPMIPEYSLREHDLRNYYTAPPGGESQVMVKYRIREMLRSMLDDRRYEHTWVISHHLAIIAAVQTVLSGTERMFFQFDRYWRPDNGSISVFVELPRVHTEDRQKLRIGAYNLVWRENM